MPNLFGLSIVFTYCSLVLMLQIYFIDPIEYLSFVVLEGYPIIG